MSIVPPTRASTSQTGLVKWCGPHHRATCAGSVHIRNTSSRGASNVRVMASSRSAIGAAALVITASLFLCESFQVDEPGFEIGADHLVHVHKGTHHLRDVWARAVHRPGD